MANTERAEQLLVSIRAQSDAIRALLAGAKTPDRLRSALSRAAALLTRLRSERKELSTELSEVRQRLAAGRPPRQWHTTWVRVEADLRADEAVYVQVLEFIERHITDTERLCRQLQHELAEPLMPPGQYLVTRAPADLSSPAGRRMPQLGRMARIGGVAAVGLLVLGIILVSRPTPSSVVPPVATAAPLPTAGPATEASDLRPRAVAETSVATAVPAATATPLAQPSPAPTTAPSATPASTATPAPTAVSTPAPRAIKGANVRAGPGTVYPILRNVRAGEVLAIDARTAQGDWYRLAGGGWLAAFLVENPPAAAPVAQVLPPTPRPPPKPTATRAPVRAAPLTVAPAPARICCKVCSSSQACGNSCISWNKSCHQPPGCACQG